MLRRLWFTLFVVTTLQAAPAAAWDPSKKEVDVGLILAVDVSPSISNARWLLQLRGYANAFRSKEVLRAIQGGSIGSIAVTFVEWSSSQFQMTSWYLINSKLSADEFAAAIGELPRLKDTGTHIGAAIDFSAALFDDPPFAAMRKIIDISGDGQDNSGYAPELSRDKAVKKGIIINGLPIVTRGEPFLAMHYASRVIGGPGAFSIAVHDMQSFEATLTKKLVLELAMR